MKLYIALRSRYNLYDVGKRYHITMSLQYQYVVGLHRDENPTKNHCRPNIACPLGWVSKG